MTFSYSLIPYPKTYGKKEEKEREREEKGMEEERREGREIERRKRRGEKGTRGQGRGEGRCKVQTLNFKLTFWPKAAFSLSILHHVSNDEFHLHVFVYTVLSI